jgi:AcrR family transcriptional regulator
VDRPQIQKMNSRIKTAQNLVACAKALNVSVTAPGGRMSVRRLPISAVRIGLNHYGIGNGNVNTKRTTGSHATREKILDVAADLFVENGYPSTPLSLIASKLAFTKAALYYHFKNKADILTGILDPLLDAIDELLQEAPKHFLDAEKRWEFMLAYSELLLSNSRAVSVLAISGSQVWVPEDVLKRIEEHKARTTELAMLPGMSEEDQVKAILLVDMLHREIVFEKGRGVVTGMTAERRREIVYGFIRESLGS